MSNLYLTLPLPPLLNRYYRKYQNIIRISADGLAFKQEVAVICQNEGVEMNTGAIALHIVVYRARKAGDIDGYIKALLDSLNGHVYADDKQVEDLHIIRRDDKHNPRCEVMVRYGH